jgi:hypothetical protein
MLRSEVRAIEYRSKAHDADALAQASVLEQVRGRHAFAASMWTELADAEDRRTLSLHRQTTTATAAAAPQLAAPLVINSSNS